MTDTVETKNTTSQAEQVNPWLKLILEMGPLVAFFGLNSQYGIMTATAGFMIATAISLVLSKLLMKKIPTMPLVSGVVVLVFGGLTLYLDDDLFIKLKPTITNVLFGSILLTAFWGFKKPLLKIVMGDTMPINDEGWGILSVRWGLFFLFLAVLNEVIWRNFSTDFWVAFKVWGVMPITLTFAICQIPIMTRYALEDPEAPKDVTESEAAKDPL